MTNLSARILRELAGAPPVLAVKCRRCRLLRPPGPDRDREICRACQLEVEQLFCDETADGPVMGNA